MYTIKNGNVTKIEETTFAALEMKESDIEEILRNNIDMICDENESMLLIGQQVKNQCLGRSDLTAVDNNGNIVLIEIKRDKKDIENRREALEFQAIRYAASYATIKDIEELVTKVYSPYIEKHNKEFELGDLTTYELGSRKLNEFLAVNDSMKSFNSKQRIILVSSDFDDQTLSAVAWLNNNGVNMSCFKLIPFIINEEIIIKVEKVLPLSRYSDYYTNLMDSKAIEGKEYKGITRRNLPKIQDMLQWGVVKPGDVIFAKIAGDEGVLLNNGNIQVDSNEMSLQVWLKGVYGWSSVQTYVFAIHKKSNKSLSEIRQEYMDSVK